jgi:hypothetical protein
MKINAIKFYTALFVLVLFLQLYLPSFKANIFVQILVLAMFFQFEKVKFPVGYLKVILPVAFIFIIGFIGAFLYRFSLVAIAKDLFHFLKPMLGLTIGYFYYKRINNFHLFVKTIVLVGFISALIHFFIILFFSNTETVSGIREFGRDNFLELFSLFFLGYYKKFEGKNLFSKQSNYYLIFCVLLISCFLYLSRTMIVSAIIALLSIHGYTLITRNTIKVFGVLVLLIFGFYAYLFSTNIQRNKGFEAFLYKIKIAPSEIFKTKIDRDNHKDLWDHWRGYEAKRAFSLMNDNPSSYVFGTGHGSLVNLKFYAPLTTDGKGMKFISELHNGYIYILYKTGIVGLFIYLSFLIRLYKNIYIKRDMVNVYISAIGLIYLFTTLTITGIYNANDTIIFILGALLFYKSQVNYKLIEN